ncbi:MAG: putative hydroxymethylpyrimidine transport system substrate-binding protein [Thermoleophilaceae bacterium]|nr:putative hydroxymethylpyrimidine transport system substrate-binding protein [Thermoleophilaceae bacterium]
MLLALAGCGEKVDVLRPTSEREFQLMLDYFPNADHAPIYAAQAGGDFKAAALKLKIRQPSDPAAPIKQVAAGRVDLAVSYEPEVLRARANGLHVIAVGALVRGPLTSIISLPRAKIESPKDLKDKTVGTAGIDYQHAYLQSILERANLPQNSVKERNVGFNLVPALVSGKVDAILGGFWNYEGIDLAQLKKHPKVLRIEDVGVPGYDELVFVANADALDRTGPLIRRFMSALQRGAVALRQDQARGVSALVKANRDLDPKLQAASVKATLPFFLPPSGKPYGWQDPERWKRFGTWMQDAGLIKSGASGASTNAYLPGS